MNILCLDQFSELGGGQRSLLDLAPAFAKNGWALSFLLPGNGSFAELLEERGFQTEFLDIGSFSNGHKPAREILCYLQSFPLTTRTIARTIERQQIDFLYVNGSRLLPAAAFVARRRGIPLLFHCHNRLTQAAAIAAVRGALLLSRAHVIACCRYVAEPFRSFLSATKFTVVYNGVRKFANPVERRFPLRRIGVFGRIEPEKGQLDFVRAVRLLARDFPACTFTITGAPLFSSRAYYNEVRRAAAGLPIEFRGWQSDAGATLASFDLLAVPSTQVEATTRVIPEAYSLGVPVVAFPSGGIPEIVQDERTGFLAAARTPEALAARIASVLHLSEARVRSIAQNAHTAWQTEYNLDCYQDHVCRIVSSLGRTDNA